MVSALDGIKGTGGGSGRDRILLFFRLFVGKIGPATLFNFPHTTVKSIKQKHSLVSPRDLADLQR